ncbi:MAG: hypothetical protein ACYC05_06435 [Sulfuricella sp.]
MPHKNVMLMNFQNERKHVLLVMLVTAAALICGFTTSFAMAGEAQSTIVADLFGDLQRTLEKSARDVINNPTGSGPRRAEQSATDQPVAPSQNPEQAIPTTTQIKKEKKPAKRADASPVPLAETTQDNGKAAVREMIPSTSNQWRVIKLGQSVSGIMFKRVGNDAVVFFDKTPIAKCVSGSDFQGERRVYLKDTLASSKVGVSPVSPTGQYMAVFCSSGYPDSDEINDAAYGIQLVNLKTKAFFSPSPHSLFQVLDPWISFSPDDRYAVLNQSGDEGNYTTLAYQGRPPGSAGEAVKV